jgi:FemAB-related protein (PEP-CTERM system-associated)
MDDIKVKELDESRQKDWNLYVASSKQTFFCHDLRWKSVVEDSYGLKPYYLLAYKKEKPVGVFPLFLVTSIFFGRFLITAPYLSYGGIISDNSAAEEALIERTKTLANELRADYVEVRNNEVCFYLPHTKSIYCTLKIYLGGGEENVWKNILTGRARNNVRRARKAGLEIIEDRNLVDVFSNLVFKTMHHLGTPSHNSKFFNAILKYYPEAKLLMVRANRKYVGGTLLVSYNNTVLGEWIACLKKYYPMQVNSFIYWESIASSCRNGFQFFDVGRSKWDTGVFKFKASFGAKAEPLYYQYYLNRAKKVPNIDPENSSFKPLITAWRHLPLSVVNFVGPRLRRCIT